MNPKRQAVVRDSRLSGVVLIALLLLLWQLSAMYVVSSPTWPTVARIFEAWFENIAWATANRQQTVAIMTPILNLKPDTVDQIYVRLMPMQSTDGKFDPNVMAAMRHAIVDLGILDTEPDISKLYTEEFLPKM